MKEKKAVTAYNLDISSIEWVANRAAVQDASASKVVNNLIKEAMNGKEKTKKSPARPRR